MPVCCNDIIPKLIIENSLQLGNGGGDILGKCITIIYFIYFNWHARYPAINDLVHNYEYEPFMASHHNKLMSRIHTAYLIFSHNT